MSFDPKYEDGSDILNALFKLPLPGLAQVQHTSSNASHLCHDHDHAN